MQVKNELYSIVVPVYGCATCLHELYNRLVKTLSSLRFEVIFVDDQSPDNAWRTIEQLCGQYPNIKGVKLSRNFGQHYAISCGLGYAEGDWIIVMDCDLQDVPEEIPALINKGDEGFDIVLARRKNRQDGFLKRTGSKLFYKIFSYLTDTKQDHTIANFGLYHNKVITAILKMGDQIRYFPTMIQWVGFNKTVIEVRHSERAEGKSSYNFVKLFNLAFNNIIAFSDKPLKLTVQFGLIISTISLIIGAYYLILYFSGEIEQLGFTSLIISIWFLSGIIILILGILGIYLGKTFEKVKNRPLFVVQEELNTKRSQ